LRDNALAEYSRLTLFSTFTAGDAMLKYILLIAASLFMGATVIGCHASADVHPDNASAVPLAR
jgi:hypothetical protein